MTRRAALPCRLSPRSGRLPRDLLLPCFIEGISLGGAVSTHVGGHMGRTSLVKNVRVPQSRPSAQVRQLVVPYRDDNMASAHCAVPSQGRRAPRWAVAYNFRFLKRSFWTLRRLAVILSEFCFPGSSSQLAVPWMGTGCLLDAPPLRSRTRGRRHK